MIPAPHAWLEFATPEALAEALARVIAGVLEEAVTVRGAALLAVSGGRTPVGLFRALSNERIAWDKVTITLVDERFVPPSSDRSNERLVRENLLRDGAEAADFVGLYSEGLSLEEAADRASKKIAALPRPFDVVVLGMGADGHTASFFPDAEALSEALDPDSAAIVLPVRAGSAGEPRLTLSLARLCEARFVALHIGGEEKRKVLERALGGTQASCLPVRAVFEHARHPVEVYWTPAEG